MSERHGGAGLFIAERAGSRKSGGICKGKFSEERIIKVLNELEAGAQVRDLPGGSGSLPVHSECAQPRAASEACRTHGSICRLL
jgi:hypothetical protein